MTPDLTETFTLITGASSGIGRQTAIRLSSGRRLVLAGRNRTELDMTRQSCANSQLHDVWEVDFSQPAQISDSLVTVLRERGYKVDSYVHSAGVLTVQPLRLTTLDMAMNMMNVNFFAAVEISRVLVSQRCNGQSLSNLVFVSSIASQFGSKGHSLYSASKGALDALMRSLAIELAPRVRVNSVLPGAISTPMTAGTFANQELADRLNQQYPLGLGTPDDIAAVIEFLISDSARWITGQQFVVDGGRTSDITG